MIFGSKKLVGIDIGSRYIKFAEVESFSKGIKILRASLVETPEGAFSGAEISNPNIIATSLAYNLKDQGYRNKNVIFGVQGTPVILKKITMLKVDSKLLDQQILWEAEQYIPFDINQVHLTYHVLGTDPNSDSMNVLLIAVQNSLIETYKEIAKLANLNLVILDVSSLAIYNIIEQTLMKRKINNFLIAHVGDHTTHLSILVNGKIEFIRDLTIGGRLFTLEIQKVLGVSLEEAETLKINFSNNGEGPEEIFKISEDFNQQITDEIKNTIDYFIGSSSDGSKIDHIFLSGGGARSFNLDNKINDVTNISCEKLDLSSFFQVSDKIKINSTDLSCFFPVAIGLGIRLKGDEK